MPAQHGQLSAALGVEPLLAALRGAGLRVGVAEVARLRAVFAEAPRIRDEQRLLGLLRAVLVHTDEERAVFERSTSAWLEAAQSAFDAAWRERAPVVAPPAGHEREERALSEGTAPPAFENVPGALATDDEDRSRRERLSARVETRLERQRTRRLLMRLRTSTAMIVWLRLVRSAWFPTLALGAGLAAAATVVGLLLWRIWPTLAAWLARADSALGQAVLVPIALPVAATLYLYLRRRRWVPAAGQAVGARVAPARFLPPLPAAGSAFLTAREQETLVWGIEHFVSEEPTTHLDIPATVRATARAAGIPQPCFLRVRHARAVWLWVDASCDDPALGRLAGEIEASLVAHGLPVERAVFWGVPERLFPEVGRPFGPNEEDERRDATQVAILTDGRLLRIQHGVDSRRVQLQALLRDLGRWPRLAVAEFSQDDGLRPLVAPWGLELLAPRDLATWLGGRAVMATVAARATRELCRQADDLAAACALAPAGSVDEGTALALAHELGVSPWALSVVHARAAGPPHRVGTADERVHLLNAFVHTEVHPGHVADGSRLARALGVLEDRYQKTPDIAKRQRWQVERALLRLWREPAEATVKLRELYGDPLREPIRQHLARLAPADRGGANHVQLPWRWEDRTDTERAFLQEMGLGGDLPTVHLGPPARNWIAVGVCCGVGAAAGGVWGIAALLATGATVLVVRGIAARRRAGLSDRPERVAGVHGVVQEDDATPSTPPVPTLAEPVTAEPEAEAIGATASTPDVETTAGGGDALAITPALVTEMATGKAGAAPLPVEPVDETPPLPAGITSLATYSFAVVTVDKRGAVRERREGAAQYFAEDLGHGVRLEMTLVPAGTFVMGSPADEAQRGTIEGPQHKVTLGPFFFGRYPVTQAQWRAVARLPKIERDLNAEPSRFKGDTRPVEQVSWHDAVEFCRRLSRHTGRAYGLPSEAQWEYACRAGITTPFHFGVTITPELVNYDGDFPYGAAPKGKDRRETTPVGSFGVANAFGLFDVHGNVWEWCQDAWHDNYNGAPVDGSPWEAGGDAARRVLRGGAWLYLAWYCRSAVRDRREPEDRDDNRGFRVVCAVSRTQ